MGLYIVKILLEKNRISYVFRPYRDGMEFQIYFK